MDSPPAVRLVRRLSPSAATALAPVARDAARAGRTVAELVLGLAFPVICVGCDRRLPGAPGSIPGRIGTSTLPLCPDCIRRLPRAGPDAAEARIARLPADAPRPDHTLALWTFDSGGTIRRLQHALKYGGRPSLGVDLGALVGRALADFWPGVEYDAIIAVPLARSRLLERGYNQAEALARGVAEGTAGRVALPVTDRVLVRRRPTTSQTKLSRETRRANVAGAFALAAGEEPAVAGRRLLIVDDVLTTGATLSAAVAPLLTAGAHVDAVVLACVAE